MEEKNAVQESRTLAWYEQHLPAGVCGSAEAVFEQWRSEGAEPAEMYRRVSDLFDEDPRGAEKFFGADFMDTVDHFTHYWN